MAICHKYWHPVNSVPPNPHQTFIHFIHPDITYHCKDILKQCYFTQNNQSDHNSIHKTKEQTTACGTTLIYGYLITLIMAYT